MALPLADKAMVISGASSGIGRATALACARVGMRVLVMARREDRLRSLCDEINSASFLTPARGGPAPGPRAAFIVGDVARQADCDAAVARCVESFGGVYGVFANAGYGVEAALHQMTDEEVRAIFEVNVFGSLNIIRAALPRLLAQRSGHVLWCSSCLAFLPLPRFGAYCATKAAQLHLSRAMGVELQGAGVHVSSVHPVGTKTEFFDVAARRSEGRGPVASRAPEWAVQPPERVANAIVRCLRRPRPEVWTSQTTRIGFLLAAFAPGLTGRVLGRRTGDAPAPGN